MSESHHLVTVWNPSYAQDAREEHLGVLIDWAGRAQAGPHSTAASAMVSTQANSIQTGGRWLLIVTENRHGFDAADALQQQHDTAQVLAELHVDIDCLIAGLLYRAVREERLAMERLRAEFGDTVAGLVDELGHDQLCGHGIAVDDALEGELAVGVDDPAGQDRQSRLDVVGDDLEGSPLDLGGLVQVARAPGAVGALGGKGGGGRPDLAQGGANDATAAEAAIGLAILVCFFRNRGTIDVEYVNVMKG